MQCQTLLHPELTPWWSFLLADGAHHKKPHSPTHPKHARGLFQYPIRRFIVRSREVSKPRDWRIELSHHSKIWQAPQQHCCWGACPISKQYYNSNSRPRYLTGFYCKIINVYWNGALECLLLDSLIWIKNYILNFSLRCNYACISQLWRRFGETRAWVDNYVIIVLRMGVNILFIINTTITGMEL